MVLGFVLLGSKRKDCGLERRIGFLGAVFVRVERGCR